MIADIEEEEAKPKVNDKRKRPDGKMEIYKPVIKSIGPWKCQTLAWEVMSDDEMRRDNVDVAM